jgi:hypothetical protein
MKQAASDISSAASREPAAHSGQFDPVIQKEMIMKKYAGGTKRQSVDGKPIYC